MKKRGKVWHTIMHAIHHCLGTHHVAMMKAFADMAKIFGRTGWIDKQFWKHDRKSGYHIDQAKAHTAALKA